MNEFCASWTEKEKVTLKIEYIATQTGALYRTIASAALAVWSRPLQFSTGAVAPRKFTGGRTRNPITLTPGADKKAKVRFNNPRVHRGLLP